MKPMELRGFALKSLPLVLASVAALSTITALGQTVPGSGSPAAVVKIDPRVTQRAESEERVPVFIVLEHQPQAEIFAQAESANALSQTIAESEVRRLAANGLPDPDSHRKAQAAVDAVILETRQRAFEAIDREVRPEQDAMASRLAGWGATRIGRYKGVNMLTAEVPGSALAQLEADPSIARVFPVEMQSAQLATSVPALGAPAFWSQGYTGQGQSVGVLDTGVRTDHPAFAGTTIISQVFLDNAAKSSCFGDYSGAMDSVGHGTHVAGIVMSEGSNGWMDYQGVAKGISALYNLKVGFKVLASCGGDAQSDQRDVLAAVDWTIGNTPLKILNYSFGSPVTTDDDGFSQALDNYADLYGLTMVIAAGNMGPDLSTVTSPGIAFNA
ncbi:MAG TPA: S8 family serine peptidase, partial [Bryobacteraceae bacterium]|nr:S8 family serine peptidase [Bryobacteraceae bacterium]